MKKTLLFTLLISASTMMAQTFSTSEQTLLSNLKATIEINGATNTTKLILVGPSNAWFSIGFGSLNMSSGSDVFRTDGTTVVDASSNARVLPPADASQDWNVESNTVSGSSRTIIATRANNTGDSNDYVFNPAEGSIPLIYAVGTSTTYAYHGGSRGFTTIGVLSAPTFNTLEFEMYPNPAKDKVTIDLPNGSQNAIVEFYDYLGKVALKETISSNNNDLNVSDLSSGMYILKVITNEKIGTKKFIKQ